MDTKKPDDIESQKDVKDVDFHLGENRLKKDDRSGDGDIESLEKYLLNKIIGWLWCCFPLFNLKPILILVPSR